MGGGIEKTTLDFALDYTALGMRLVSIPQQAAKAVGKGSVLKEASELTEAEIGGWFQDEGESSNVAFVPGEHSGWIVDVDLDHELLAPLADALMTETGAVFGRPGRPRSHRLYRVPDARFRELKVLDSEGKKRKVLEIRATSSEEPWGTMLPPSTHPEGGNYAWAEYGSVEEIVQLKTDRLERECREVVTAFAIAQAMPGRGEGRHYFLLPVLGFLLRPGRFGEETAVRLLEAAADVSGHRDDAERQEWRSEVDRAAKSTTERLEADEPVQGGGELEEQAPGLAKTIANLWGWEKKSKGGAGEEEETQARALIRLAEPAELFHDSEGAAYATVPVEGHPETHSVRTRGFKNWLRYRFFREQAKPPGAQALQDAVETLAAKAEFEGAEMQAHVRVAAHGKNIYLDLANEEREVVEITEDGWRVLPLKDAPVRFRRPKGMFPLPRPRRDGSLEPLYDLLNLADEESQTLITAWLVAALRPSGPYPVLILQGEQGTAKSTAARVLRSLIDPNKAPLRENPREGRDLAIAANNGHVIGYDNISYLPPWLSDALCRVATGGGFATRQLYTDDEEKLFDFQRPIVLNGITDVATRPDLLDRALLVGLPTISKKRRRAERELYAELERVKPEILGALLDAVSVAIRNLDGVELEERPRLSDFAEWLTAAEEGLGWRPGYFMEKYAGAMSENQERALASDPVAEAVLSFMADKREWTGTPTELHDALTRRTSDSTARSRSWPRQPQHLTGRLTRLAPPLREQGLLFEEYQEGDRNKTRKKRLCWEEGRGPTEEEMKKAREDSKKGGMFKSPY